MHITKNAFRSTRTIKTIIKTVPIWRALKSWLLCISTSFWVLAAPESWSKHIGRTPWSCGLISHVLDWKVEGSNLAAAKFLCNINKLLLRTIDHRWWSKKETPHYRGSIFKKTYRGMCFDPLQKGQWMLILS